MLLLTDCVAVRSQVGTPNKRQSTVSVPSRTRTAGVNAFSKHSRDKASVAGALNCQQVSTSVLIRAFLYITRNSISSKTLGATQVHRSQSPHRV